MASSEFLLCGLPVVSTPSSGGRDVWYNDRNAVICAPTSAAVREAVEEIKTGLETGRFDRIQIRGHHVRLAQVMRDRFNNCVQHLFDRYGVIRDAREHLHEVFISQMFRVIPLADAKRLLTMGADAMQAQFEIGRAAGTAPP